VYLLHRSDSVLEYVSVTCDAFTVDLVNFGI